MNTSPTPYVSSVDSIKSPGQRFSSSGGYPTILTDIYHEHINIAIWRRTIDGELKKAVEQFLAANSQYQKSVTLSPSRVHTELEKLTNGTAPKVLLDNMAELVDMFCCLFDLKYTGLRLAKFNGAMCPRFHVDQVPCRLVTTFYGPGTQWLPNHTVKRAKLGHGSQGQEDSVSGLYSQEGDIQQLSCGDVAILKGECWIGNENAGLVHRSPPTKAETRLLMTLDLS